MFVHTFHPSTFEAEGINPVCQDQPSLHRKFQDNQTYITKKLSQKEKKRYIQNKYILFYLTFIFLPFIIAEHIFVFRTYSLTYNIIIPIKYPFVLGIGNT